MDPSSVIQLIIIIILLILSAFFSSAETAFTTVNKIRIRSLIDEGNKKAVKVSKIIDNSSKMLSAILIGNNIVNLSASAMVTSLTIKLLGDVYSGIATGILTVLILIFGEITPKTAASIKSEKFALSYANVIYGLIYILTPAIFLLDKLSSLVMHAMHIDPNSKKSAITENELRTIVDVSHEEGVIESEERRIINNLFDFGDSKARDVMIPRIDMSMADVNSSYDDILKLFRQEKYTRFPIYEESVDNVIGIINVKDLLQFDSHDDFNIRNIMREPYFTYEYKNTTELMEELRKTCNNITIVIDEYGSTVGMITLEDLLEEIIGDIKDEYDTDERESIIKINSNEYIVEGSAKLDDIQDIIGIKIDSDDYDSIGGYIIEHLDRFPNIGDVVYENNYKLIIDSVSKNRIESVHILITNHAE